MFACTREQVIGQSINRFFPKVKPDGRKAREKMQEMIITASRGKPQFFEWKCCRYDGTLFDAEISMNVYSFGDKNYIQGYIHDITKRKNIDDQIHYLATHDSLTGLPIVGPRY